MSDTHEDRTPTDDLSEALIERIDGLELRELKSLRTYIEQRITSLQKPFEGEIEASAAGEVLDVEDHGAYALVRKHPPNPDGPGVDTTTTSLYHVRPEPKYDGTESLHWAYLGDIEDTAGARCETCGRTFDREIDVCPHCGSDEVDSETQE